mgnify:CR=1 FL=1
MTSGLLGSLRLVDADLADGAAVADLLAKVLSNGGVAKKSPDFWRWKHLDNPFGASCGVVAFDEEGVAVCSRPLMRWRLRTQSSDCITAVRPVDTATHPDWQGKGLFSSLTRVAIQRLDGSGARVLFNTPNKNSLPGYIKMGWVHVSRVDVFAIPALLRRPQDRPAKSADSDSRVLSFKLSSAHGESDAATEMCAEVFQAMRLDESLRTEKSTEFLRWRYANHPNALYDAKVLLSASGRPIACMIYRIEKRAGLVVAIACELGECFRGAMRELLGCARFDRRVSAIVYAGHGRFSKPAMLGPCGGFFVRSVPVVAKEMGAAHESSESAGLTKGLSLSLGDLESF